MLRVKICGITNLQDALAACAFGADALGFVFYERSPRYISPERAREIIRRLPPFVSTVGVFVDRPPQEVERMVRQVGLDVAQLHGHEPPEHCQAPFRLIKAIRVRELRDLRAVEPYKGLVSALLLDAYSPEALGGTGQVFNWSVALDAEVLEGVRVILAGGLRPDNVAEAVRLVRPYGVDVASGVEAEKGVKDHHKLRLFIQAAKAALPAP
jgi:phosphoribosylanthranilate isomerase